MVDGDELGPIDYLVVEFPAGSRDFGGELARELASLVDAEMVRVLDMLVLEKHEDGHVEAFEMEQLGDRPTLRAIESELAEILAIDDVDRLAAAVPPGSVAGVLIWENLWAAPFGAAARADGGRLVATGRIPTPTVVHALDCCPDIASGDLTRRPGRVGRVSVIDRPAI
jgi:hypothetical protein